MKIHNYRQVKGIPSGPGVTMRIMAGTEEKAPNFVMRLFEIEQGCSTPSHTHPWEHEMFVVEGKGVLISGAQETPVGPGDAAMILPGEHHCVRNTHREMLRVICVVPLVDGKMPGMPAAE